MGTRLQRWLDKKIDQPFNLFSGLIQGGLIFVLGYLVIFASNHYMIPSIRQELIALAGLVICLTGSVFWLKNYLTIIMVKILKKPDQAGENKHE
ncbi:hypothetical protein [Gynuella sunshinyii]|uniref:Uncharacterized protein n=1 Tax=Gynuella sunshinyii YC6258 TaxID=1445510 RepID=A0A0C5W277_9GAMM|nr:hypothetical protein [Gynuella sunshinyii]AJQ96754.1 hypothetical Protein YC6258_04722 [Gynuella sunshinyii YC6258]